jgi:hypothetical protein
MSLFTAIACKAKTIGAFLRYSMAASDGAMLCRLVLRAMIKNEQMNFVGKCHENVKNAVKMQLLSHLANALDARPWKNHTIVLVALCSDHFILYDVSSHRSD